MIELRHIDVRHVVSVECSYLANGYTIKCDCIGLILFRYLSCLGAIICDINAIFVAGVDACSVCDALVASCAIVP